MAEIEDAYNRLAGNREEYLRQGSRNQRLTVTIARDMFAGGLVEQVNPDLHNVIGKIIVKAQTASLVSTLFPINVFWFRFIILTKDQRLQGDAIQHQLAEAERDHMRLFDQLLLKSALNHTFLNASVWGQNVIHLKEEDDRGPIRTRTFDLSEHVTEWTDGFIRRTIVKEPWKDDPLDPDEKATALFTEADYLTGGVRQEMNSKIEDVDDEAARWIVINHQRPVKGEHFPISTVTEFFQKIRHANGMARALKDIVFEAARIYKGVRAGSGLDPHKLNRIKSGAFIVMHRPDDIFYPQQQTQLVPGLAVVEQHLERTERELETAFNFGLRNRQPQPGTATLVRQIVAEMDDVGSQFYMHHQDWTQLPLARGLMSMSGFKVEGPNGRVLPTILTGLSALSRQEESDLFVRLIERLGTISPEWVASLPMNKIFQRLADGFQIETGDFSTTEGRVQDIFRELIAVIQEDPAKVLPLLLQLIQQFDPQFVAQAAGAVQQAALQADGQEGQPQPQQQQQKALPAPAEVGERASAA